MARSPSAELSLRIHPRIAEIPEAAWTALVGADPVPTLRWKWIHALEDSGSASAETGWEPAHLALYRRSELIAAAPAYRKHHSMGEYIYDFAWAQAAQRMGIEYYPKLLLGVALSPLTSSKFLVAAKEDPTECRQALLSAAVTLAQETESSGVHILFSPEEEAKEVEGETPFHRRTTVQFHWKNAGYKTYDDFLARFDSKRRNQLRRERAEASKQGIDIRTVAGPELTEKHADAAHDFYESTVEKKGWGHLQLNRAFFRQVFATMPEAVELVEARRGSKLVAGAFNLLGANRRYGRYWGCFEEVPFLHFNVCLYHSIDACIREGRDVFEPGAGGEHKVSRGFIPTAIHSAHKVFDRRLDTAIGHFVAREREVLDAELAHAEALTGLRPKSDV